MWCTSLELTIKAFDQVGGVEFSPVGAWERHEGDGYVKVARLFALLEERGPDHVRSALTACVEQGRNDIFVVEAALKGIA